MKKVIFILFAFCIFTVIAYSQLNIIDNSREKLWYIVSGSICSPLEICNPETSVIKFGNEVIINGLTYTTVLKSTDSVFASLETIGYLRESDRKVYYRPLSRNSDYVLYDFNLGLSSKIYLTNTLSSRDSLEYTVYGIDSVFIGSEKRKRMFLSGFHNEIWIEGIGSLDGLIFSGMGMDGGFNDLSCFSENGNVIYKNPKYENHDCSGLKKNALIMDKWEENEFIYNSTSPNGIDTLKYTYWFEGDTIFNDLKYEKAHRKIYNNGVEYNFLNFLFIRESNDGKLYFIDGNYPNEFILYDFSKWECNDSVFRICLDGNKYSTCASTIITNENLASVLLMNGNYAQYVKKASDIYIINGIGFKSGFFSHISTYAGNYMGGEMVRCYNGSNIIWQNPKYTSMHNVENVEKFKSYVSQGCLLFELNSKASIIDLYTIDGKFKKSYFVEGCELFTTEKQKPGFYIYQIRDKNQKTIITGKVNIR